MRNYQGLVVLDYIIENYKDIVELGIPNPNYNPRENNSDPLIHGFVDPTEIFEDVKNLESRLGTDNPIVKAGKDVIERMDKIRQRKYVPESDRQPVLHPV